MPDTFTPEQISQILEEFFKVVGTRQYIGPRLVPLFGRKDEDSIEWDNTAPYEPLTIVLYQGNSYTSRQFVPVGVEITNQEFWAITGNYNAQVELYRRETAAAREIADNALAAANNAQGDINTLLPKTAFSADNTVKDSIDNDTNHVFKFANVAQMAASENISAGAICQTAQFSNEGGGALYVIDASGTPNGMDVIECANSLYAHLVIDENVTLATFGALENNSIDNIIARMLDLGIYVNGECRTYKISNPIRPRTEMHFKNTVFDFDGSCNGMFERFSTEVYNSPTTVFADTIEVDGCEFINAVDHVPAATSQTSYDAALPIYAKYVYIRNSKFHDNDCHGMVMYANLNNEEFCKEAIIESCEAYNNGVYDWSDHSIAKTGIGIGAYLDANEIDSNILISNCYAHDNANSGIAPHGIANVVISNCISNKNNEHGFVFQTNKHGSIDNCIAVDNWSRGVRIQGDWNIEPVYCTNVTVTNCVVTGSRFVRIGGGVHNVLVDNCISDLTGAASASAIDFDPYDYPDGNIIVQNCIFNGPSNISVLGNVRAQDKNIVIKNATVNEKPFPYAGFDVNQGGNLYQAIMLSMFEPMDYYLTSENLIDGSAQTSATFTDNVLTATATGGYLYKTINTANVHHMIIYALAKILLTHSGGTGVIRLSLRNGSAEAASLSYPTQHRSNFTEDFCNWGMIVDVDKLREQYTFDAIRIAFVLSANGDSVQFDKFVAKTA